MDAKEELNEIKRLLLTLRFETAKDQQVSYDIIERVERNRIKQARNEALEEAAKVADDCAGHYSPECECMNIAEAIRDLKEK